MTKEDKKGILCIVGVIIVQTFIYFITKLTPFNTNMLSSNFDNKIPFVPGFIYFYVSWYLMLLFFPYLLYKKNKNVFKKYMLSMIIANVIAGFIYFFYPTTMARVNVSGNTLSCVITKIVYFLDTPICNCLPSMHCILCFFYIFYIKDIKNISLLKKIMIILWSILIILSTLFVKQHVIIDVISAFIISSVIYILINILFKKKK